MRISLATMAAGGILLFIGVVPLWIVSEFIPAGDTTFYGFLFLLLTPPGILIFAIGIILWLVAVLRARV